MRYGTVCSGIGAPEVAATRLGWQCQFMSEIERFPRAVLQHHYPDVPLHGDFTTIGENDYGAIDVLIGGTPCQDFSVAGLRAGITGERGNLTLEFVRLAARLKPRWVVWENVPGVLSSGRAFGAFLGGMAECGYGFAYRVLDARYFGVPQRRRRVFVIGYLGDWRPPAAVLFERESLRRDITPCREPRENVAPTISARTKGGGGLGTDFDCDGGLIPETAWALQERDAKGVDSNTKEGHLIPMAPCYPINTQIAMRHEAMGEGTGLGIGAHGDPSFILQAAHSHAVAFDIRGRDGGAQAEGVHDTANIRASSGGSSRSYVAATQVRRLTPRECERLQGFPDDYTNIPNHGVGVADSPRYKALGNSMAVPVVHWLLKRIEEVEALRAGK